MFRYVLALLLINACYHSLGLPVVERKNVSASLLILANQCGNPLVSNQIKSKIKECSVFVPPYSEKQFQCLMFYDINEQLCSAVAASKQVLNEDYIAKINEEQDVNKLCEAAKQWIFSNMTEYPNYKIDIEKVFGHSVTCGKVCAAEELISDDANFYCKYFKWGSELLKNQVNSQKSISNATTPVLPDSSASNGIKPAVSTPTNKEPLDIPIKNMISSDKLNASESSSIITPKKFIDPNSHEVKPETDAQATSTNNLTSGAVDILKPGAIDNANVDIPKLEPSAPVHMPADKNDPEEAVQQPIAAKDLHLLKTGQDEQSLNIEPEHKEAVLENPKIKPQGDIDDDYPGNEDSEEGKEGLIDMQEADDGDDPMVGDDMKPEQVPNKADQKKESMSSSFNRDGSQKEFYPSTIQDGFTEDDDHFFTFFLTAVILVVLIYVLYHNKNKVSKVFFGLILEGRQAGRRRNSRGHAYRRLDTLEQAMSTNTAAPPSKIIY